MKNNKLALTALAAALVAGCGGSDDSVSFNTPTFDARNLHYTYPLDNQQQVAPRAIIALQFSHEVTADASNFTVTGPDDEAVPFTLESVADGRGVVLTPDDALKPASDYKVVMNGVTVLGETTTFKDGTLNFTTRAALEGPIETQKTAASFEVESIFPDDGQFKSMDFSSFRLRTTHPIDASSAVYGDTISLMNNGEVVPALLLVGRTTITVDPLEDMTPGDTYELSVNGVKSQLGEDIAAYSHSTVPQDTTSPTTGERAVLVTNAPPADDSLGCLDDGVRLSELTGQPINCVPVIGTLLQDKTVSKQSGDVYAELAFTPNFPDVTPLRVQRGLKQHKRCHRKCWWRKPFVHCQIFPQMRQFARIHRTMEPCQGDMRVILVLGGWQSRAPDRRHHLALQPRQRRIFHNTRIQQGRAAFAKRPQPR